MPLMPPQQNLLLMMPLHTPFPETPDPSSSDQAQLAEENRVFTTNQSHPTSGPTSSTNQNRGSTSIPSPLPETVNSPLATLFLDLQQIHQEVLNKDFHFNPNPFKHILKTLLGPGSLCIGKSKVNQHFTPRINSIKNPEALKSFLVDICDNFPNTFAYEISRCTCVWGDENVTDAVNPRNSCRTDRWNEDCGAWLTSYEFRIPRKLVEISNRFHLYWPYILNHVPEINRLQYFTTLILSPRLTTLTHCY